MKTIRSAFCLILAVVVSLSCIVPAFAEENVSFSEENAEKAVIVAFTNVFAEDVLASDGKTYDSTKYHGYNYNGQYKMVVDSDYKSPTWEQKSDNTWHVDNLYLRLHDFHYVVKISCDVSFDGNNYTISDAHYIFADSAHIGKIEQNPSKIVEENTINADSVYSMLIVPADFVSGNGGNNYEPADIVACSQRYGWSLAYDYWNMTNFSLFNGSNKKLNKLIQSQLNDEKSFKHIKTETVEAISESEVKRINDILADAGYSDRVQLNDVFAMVQFSAKNKFNATVKAMAYGIISYRNDTVTVVDIVSN